MPMRKMFITSSRMQLVAGSARPATNFTRGAAAMSRLRRICGCMCGHRSMRSAVADSAELIETLIARAEKARCRPRCRRTRIFSGQSRCWSRIGCWRIAEMLFRDADRLADCRERLNVCPLGSGAIAGSDSEVGSGAGWRRNLEFDGATANSMDATSDRDFALEFVQALSVLAVHLSRWAEEFISFRTTRIWVRASCRSSFRRAAARCRRRRIRTRLELIRGKVGPAWRMRFAQRDHA